MQENLSKMKESGHFEGQPEAWAGRAMPGPGWAVRHPGNDEKACKPLQKQAFEPKSMPQGGLLAGRGVFSTDNLSFHR